MPFDQNSAKKAGKKSKRSILRKCVKDSAVYLSIEFKYNLSDFSDS
jgi:hypothetical protein